jgi:hypothetical protein
MTLGTYTLETRGWLPGWAGLLLFAGAAAWGLWQHYREFPEANRGALRGRVLPALRVLIVATAVWLLCQPRLVRVQTATQRPTLLLVSDTGPTMRAREEFGALSNKLDLLEQLEGQAVPGRQRRPGLLARQARDLRLRLDDTHRALAAHFQQEEQGLPLDPAAAKLIGELGRDLTARLDALAQATLGETSGWPAPLPDQAAQAQALATRLQVDLRALASDAETVAREGLRHPQLLRESHARCGAARDAAQALAEAAHALQAALDEAMLAPDVVAATRQRALSRQAWADLATARLRERFGADYQVESLTAAGLPNAVAASFRRHLQQPVGAVVLFSDGSQGAVGDLLPQTPVHTVLLGHDGEEPPDLALVAVELWPVAVREQPTTLRALVKHRLPADRGATLEIRQGDQVLASAPLTDAARGLRIVELPLTFREAGRADLTIAVVPQGGDDAYAGNERQTRAVTVLPRPARVVLLGGALSNDFAAIRQVLGELPFVETTPLLSAPELAKLGIGGEANQFPGEASAWGDVRLAVLVGPAPAELTAAEAAPALAAFDQAIAAGLQVLALDGGEPAGWAARLGLRPVPVAPPARLMPVPAAWHELYRLGTTHEASQDAWASLPALTAGRAVPEATPLLTAGGLPVVGVVPRGQGRLIYAGLAPLQQLRGGGAAAVNRLLAGLLTYAVAADDGVPRDGAESLAAELQLAPRAAPLTALSQQTGGQALTLAELDRLTLPEPRAVARQEIRVAAWGLWRGWWPLPLLLLLTAAEYLLRRRACLPRLRPWSAPRSAAI